MRWAAGGRNATCPGAAVFEQVAGGMSWDENCSIWARLGQGVGGPRWVERKENGMGFTAKLI